MSVFIGETSTVLFWAMFAREELERTCPEAALHKYGVPAKATTHALWITWY